MKYSEKRVRLTALQKDIIRLAQEYEILTADIISQYYDETKWTIKMNLYKLEKMGLIKRNKPRKLEFIIN